MDKQIIKSKVVRFMDKQQSVLDVYFTIEGKIHFVIVNDGYNKFSDFIIPYDENIDDFIRDETTTTKKALLLAKMLKGG